MSYEWLVTGKEIDVDEVEQKVQDIAEYFRRHTVARERVIAMIVSPRSLFAKSQRILFEPPYMVPIQKYIKAIRLYVALELTSFCIGIITF